MTNYSYVTNIPLETNSPSEDQPDMKLNTNSIAGLLNEDLIGFGQTNGGLHKKASFVAQGSNPGSSSGMYVEYSKASAGQTEVFAQKDGTVTPIQLTRGVPSASSSGSSYLPGGILIQWATVTFTGTATSVTWTYPTAFTSTVYSLTGNGAGSSGAGAFSVFFDSPPAGLTSVTVRRDPGASGSSAYVLAIGV